MTVRSRRPGERSRPAASLTARAAAVLVAGVLALSPLTAEPAMAASPTPSPSPSSASGTLTLTLSPLANGVVVPGGALSVSATLTNETLSGTAPAEVTLAVGSAPLPDRNTLSRWLAGGTAGVAVTPVATTMLPAVPALSGQTAGITVAGSDPALIGKTPGVYPLLASVEVGQQIEMSTSVMIVPSANAASAGIGVIVPITVSGLSEGLLTAPELTALTSPNGSLSEQLGGVENTDAILAVDPAILASIRVLGSAAPVTATAWLQRLQSLTNPRFALQYGDADVAAQLQAGLPSPAQPTSLQPYMDPTDFMSSSSSPRPDSSPVTSPPTASPSPGVPVFPSLEELLDVGSTSAPVFWPAPGTPTPDVVATLGALRDGDSASLTVVSSAAVETADDERPLHAHSIAGEAGLLVYDEAVSAELRDASLQNDTTVRGASLAAATAYLSFAVAAASGQPILVTVDRAQDRSRVALRPAITAATTAPGVAPVTLEAIAGASAAPVLLRDTPADDARVTAASDFFADEDQLARFATVLDDPVELTAPNRAEGLQLLGNGWRDDPEEWAAAVATHQDGIRDDLASVEILPPSQIQLLTAEAGMPVYVRNALAYPVEVVLYARSNDLRLEVQPQIEVTAAPLSNTRVVVPVEARVGSGEVTVSLQLRSRTFEPIGATRYADVNVRADWEGIGIVSLGVIVGGLLVLGLVRTVLSRRRRARIDEHSDNGIHQDEPSVDPPHDTPDTPSESV